MRGNRTLIILAVVLLAVALIGGFLWMRFGGGIGQEPEVTPTEDVTARIEIVVAAQDISRGKQILSAENAVILQPWPEDSLPLEYFTDIAQVEGKFARMDIPRAMPVVPSLLGEPGGMLSVSGSSAALFEAGRVAYAIPMDTLGAVAWAPQPGDHVDVLAAIKLMKVDEEFQSPLPNLFQSLPAGEEEVPLAGTFGRFESLPNGQEALIFQSALSVPNLVVQLTVQDAIVWHVGTWTESQTTGVEGTSAPADTGQPALGQTTTEAPPVPVAQVTGDIVKPVTLLVTHQDALVLKYLLEMGADMDIVLRPAGDTAPAITETVWLRYVLDRYQLPETTDLQVAPTPVRETLELTPEPTEEVAE
ncbi:MAG: SAF domain-containing protein [Anaerolineae bacterium]|jgi:Flp pilus assembly protein CpaB|nr:SAF domain-containing protein [Anaerolineae bacterium]